MVVSIDLFRVIKRPEATLATLVVVAVVVMVVVVERVCSRLYAVGPEFVG